MDSLTQVELIQAKQLIDESLYDEALQLIKDFEDKGVLNLTEKIFSQLLKSDIYLQCGSYDRAFKLAEQAYEDSLGLGKNLISVDALLLMVEAGLPGYPFEKLLEIFKQAEELLDKFTKPIKTEYNRCKANILYLKGRYYAATYIADRFNKSLKCLEQSLTMRRELGFKRDIISSLISLSINLGFGWEIERGLRYANESLKLAKEIKNRYLIASSMKALMLLYSFKGELDLSLSYAEQSLALFEEINHIPEIARVLTQIGDKYIRKGDFERSLEYLERSLVLYKNLNFPGFKAVLICTLIEVNIALPNIESANYYLKQLEQLYEQDSSKWI